MVKRLKTQRQAEEKERNVSAVKPNAPPQEDAEVKDEDNTRNKKSQFGQATYQGKKKH